MCGTFEWPTENQFVKKEGQYELVTLKGKQTKSRHGSLTNLSR